MAKISYMGVNKDVVRRLSTTITGKSTEELQKMKAELELKDCTFAPAVPHAPTKATATVRRSVSTSAASSAMEPLPSSLQKFGSIFERIETEARQEINREAERPAPSGAKFSTKPLNLISAVVATDEKSTAQATTKHNTKSVVSKKPVRPNPHSEPEKARELKPRVSVVPKSTSVPPEPKPEPRNSLPLTVDRKTFDAFTKELKHMTSFPVSIKLFSEAVICFVGYALAADDKETTEQALRKLISTGDLFDRLCGVEIVPAVANRMKKFRENSMFTPALLSRSSKVAGDICSWLLRETADEPKLTIAASSSPMQMRATGSNSSPHTPPTSAMIYASGAPNAAPALVKELTEQIARLETTTGSESKEDDAVNRQQTTESSYMYCPITDPSAEHDDQGESQLGI
jgi:hypothetical protein